MDIENDLQELQAYSNEQFRAARDRLLQNPFLPKLVASYFPNVEFKVFAQLFSALQTVADFQSRIVSPAMDRLLKIGSAGVTYSGCEGLSPGKRYLFLSNHRDIVCDPALFAHGLHGRGLGTPKVCLGDNLLTDSLVTDLIKMNKGVTVKRDLPPRELLRWSHALSELIYRSVTRGEDSVWIAQKEGRTKDGDDRTQTGVIKMLTMAGHGTFSERAAELHIVPVAVSYEFDPCDIYKARELHITQTRGDYIKAPGEDHRSMLESIRGFKGRIHISVGRELSEECQGLGLMYDQAAKPANKKEQLSAIAEAADRQIHRLYRCWPSNSIAADLRAGATAFSEQYTESEKADFLQRLETRLDGLGTLSNSDRAGIRARLLEAYAQPVFNRQNALSSLPQQEDARSRQAALS